MEGFCFCLFVCLFFYMLRQHFNWASLNPKLWFLSRVPCQAEMLIKEIGFEFDRLRTLLVHSQCVRTIFVAKPCDPPVQLFSQYFGIYLLSLCTVLWAPVCQSTYVGVSSLLPHRGLENKPMQPGLTWWAVLAHDSLSFEVRFECFACMYVHVPHACLVPMQVKRECQICNWSYRWYEPPCGCWESDRGPSLERLTSVPVLLILIFLATVCSLHYEILKLICLLPFQWGRAMNSKERDGTTKLILYI